MNWIVRAGAFENQITVNLFGPALVKIHVGDTVTWKGTPGEPHTVTFLAGEAQPPDFVPLPDGRLSINPKVGLPTHQGPPPPYDGTTYLNSGLFTSPDFAVTFTKEGAFNYLCLIHPGMTGQVVVEPAGTALPSQAELDQQAAAVFAPLLDAGRALKQAEDKPRSEAGADGAMRWRVKMGAETSGAELLAFLGGNITIPQGDTVVFDYTSHAPHNALFPVGGKAPEFILAEPQQNGPPTLVVNPQVLAPSQPSGGSYDGNAMLNTGLYTAPQFGASYAVTFTKPGTYSYLCSVHGIVDQNGQFQGMVGTITVAAKAAAPAPNVGQAPPPVTQPVQLPNTGRDRTTLLVLFGGALALFIVGGYLRRRPS